jgi:hypothetical protein
VGVHRQWFGWMRDEQIVEPDDDEESERYIDGPVELQENVR